MATIITSPGDNLGTILTQLSERQDQLTNEIDALGSLIADQSIRADEQDEQLRIQATALRATATQLSTNISNIARQNGGGGTVKPNGKSNDPGNPGKSGKSGKSDNPGKSSNPSKSGNPGNNPGPRRPAIVGARAGGAVNVGPIEGGAEIGGGLTAPPDQHVKAERGPEPKDEAPRRKVHRWF